MSTAKQVQNQMTILLTKEDLKQFPKFPNSLTRLPSGAPLPLPKALLFSLYEVITPLAGTIARFLLSSIATIATTSQWLVQVARKTQRICRGVRQPLHFYCRRLDNRWRCPWWQGNKQGRAGGVAGGLGGLERGLFWLLGNVSVAREDRKLELELELESWWPGRSSSLDSGNSRDLTPALEFLQCGAVW